MRPYVSHWIPAIFCAFLCLIAIVTSSTIVFFSFLPMCFVFAGIVTYSMFRQIRELKAELAELRAVRPK
jgi:hypothetical protein